MRSRVSSVIAGLVLVACTDDGGASSAGSADAEDTIETNTPSSEATGDGDPGDGDPGDGDPGDGDPGDGDPGDGDGDGDPGDGDPDPIKWDVLDADLDGGCAGEGGDLESMIWIANSSQGTVSKIDTQALTELGRYWVRPDHAGSPSRTSVNAVGDMVVGARHGGVTKIFFDVDNCVDSNGTPGIQTSSGANDILDWDQEECRAWHTPMNYTSIRAVSWTNGIWNEQTCTWEGMEVWVSGDQGQMGTVDVMRLDGETGMIVEMIQVPEMPISLNVGAYGAVVDEGNNLWLAQIYSEHLTRVDYQTLDYEHWIQPIHTYGIAYHGGYIYLCNREVARFDPNTETFDMIEMIEDWNGFYGHTGGCMVDGDGILWKGIDDALYGVDTANLQVVDTIAMPEGMQWGVAVDFDGFVWTVPRNGTTAYRVDPGDHSIMSVSGLVGAYTYSDMTGFMLSGVAAG